jgi:hypothetical protein
MLPTRPRSAAVTAAATLALLGCSAAFLFWGSFILNILNAPPDEQGMRVYQLHPWILITVAVVPSMLIAVGIKTGIGLFQLRPWARVTALIWAACALLFCLAIIALRPFETFFIKEEFVSQRETMRQLFAIALVILLLPVSVWWLFLFRMKSVKEQFRAAQQESSPTE